LKIALCATNRIALPLAQQPHRIGLGVVVDEPTTSMAHPDPVFGRGALRRRKALVEARSTWCCGGDVSANADVADAFLLAWTDRHGAACRVGTQKRHLRGELSEYSERKVVARTSRGAAKRSRCRCLRRRLPSCPCRDHSFRSCHDGHTIPQGADRAASRSPPAVPGSTS
jgi:hypothetical protein